MELLSYWEEHPPVYLLLQGVASGLAGKQIGKTPEERKQVVKMKYTSAEELLQIVGKLELR